MNGVSEANLAIAVAKEEVCPSLFFYNYFYGNWFELLSNDLERIRKEIDGDIILSLQPDDLIKYLKDLLHLIFKYRITHLELLGLDPTDKSVLNAFNVLKKHNIKMIYKSNKYPEDPSQEVMDIIDGIILKSSTGAGRVVNIDMNMNQLIRHCKTNNPNLAIIACGGIGSYKDIQQYIDAGADYVGIGTLFALSKESIISEQTKLAAISNKHLTKLKSGSMEQNAILIDKEKPIYDPTNQFTKNNTAGLLKAIRGNGGHIFMGEGVNTVDSILPVSEIIAKLGFSQSTDIHDHEDEYHQVQ